MNNQYIEQLMPLVKDMCASGKTGGHDISHLMRTMKTALYLQSKEGGDPLIIGIASFLHDVHRFLQSNRQEYVTPKESLPTVLELIQKANLDLTEEQIQQILFCIEHHEDYNWNGNNVDDLNTLILQDADNLDAIGAIGIGRSFGYAAINDQPFYDDTIPFDDSKVYEEKLKDVSNIHFLKHKLMKLGDNMNTHTAKELAKERIQFIQDFIDEYLKEWNADY